MGYREIAGGREEDGTAVVRGAGEAAPVPDSCGDETIFYGQEEPELKVSVRCAGAYGGSDSPVWICDRD